MPKRACIECGAVCDNGRCPKHPGRPANAHWSTGRNRKAQALFRRRVLAAAGFQCQALIDGIRCPITGAENLEAHHLEPGNDDPATGAALCKSPPRGHGHHRAVDAHAR